MSDVSIGALRVADLDASLRFYVEGLGFARLQRDDADDLTLLDAAGFPVWLVGPEADLASQPKLAEVLIEPGGTLHVGERDLAGRQAELAARGIEALLVARPWGDQTLRVRDPDGYTVSFWAPTEWTRQETIALYAAGPRRLEAALRGLDDAALDLDPAPDAWTIRQIVHHLADTEASFLGAPMFALAEPGRRYDGNAFHQDTWARALAYHLRPIAPSVALFGAIRAHVLQLLTIIPDAWERYTLDAEGRPRPTVGTLVGMQASHALEHIEEICEIRQARGRGRDDSK